MTAASAPVVAWLALAAGLLLVPGPGAATLRARALARPGSPSSSAGGGGTDRQWWAIRRSIVLRLLVLAGAALVAVVGASAGPALGAAAAVSGLCAARLAAGASARRARERRMRDLLAAVRLLVAEIEAGARPAAALSAAAEGDAHHAGVLREAARAAGAGADVAPILLGDAALEPLAHAWSIAVRAGTPLAEVLSGVAADLAARIAQARAVAVALAPARSTAALLAGLPVVGVGLGAAMGAEPLQFLTGSPSGRLVACGGVVLDAVGLLWTQRLARRAERP